MVQISTAGAGATTTFGSCCILLHSYSF